MVWNRKKLGWMKCVERMQKSRLTYFLVHRADGALHLSVQRLDGKNISSPVQQVADLVGGETRTHPLRSGV